MVDVYLRSVPSDANQPDVRLYNPTTADSTGPVSGTASQTLGSFTQVATGSLLIQGQASQAIGAFTQASTGRLLIKGQASQTLGAFSQVATGRLLIRGQFAQTLGAFTQAATGTLVAVRSGTASQTLGAFTQASTGTLLLKAQYSQTLGAFTQTGTGTLLIKGQAGQTLGAFTLAATGTQGTPSAINGTASQTLDAFTQVATGAIAIQAFGAGYAVRLRKPRKTREPDALRKQIEALLNRAPTKAAEEERAESPVIETIEQRVTTAVLPYVLDERINWTAIFEQAQMRANLERDMRRYEAEMQRLRDEEDEEDELLLLS